MDGITIGVFINNYDLSLFMDWETIRVLLQNIFIFIFFALVLIAFISEVFRDVGNDLKKRANGPERFIEKDDDGKTDDTHYPSFANKVILSNKKIIKPNGKEFKSKSKPKLMKKLMTLDELKKFREEAKKRIKKWEKEK